MASDKEDFDTIGPTHLSSIDWDNDNHRRSIAASLVYGVYTLEEDRHEKRHGREAVAPPWWTFFHFRLLRPLIDDVSIFGAIFEYTLKIKPSHHHGRNTTSSSSNTTKKAIPHYVIAFRGTLTEGDSVFRDMQHDIHVMKNGFEETSRVDMALQSVRDTVAMAHKSKSHLWLAGHSLGAAMVMHCGKKMALTDDDGHSCLLESFLFNPPFLSAPIERIKNENVKHGLRIAASIATAGLAFAMSVKHPEKEKERIMDNSFERLTTWVPNLFVHPNDYICSEYIGYFVHQEELEEFGVGGIGKLAAQHSLGGLVMTALGKQELNSELPLHLIPSACLTVNISPAPDFMAAHALKQWWRNDLQLQTKVYAKR